MKFETPGQRAPEEPAERDDVRLAASRCPFCHDDVSARESVVCQDCLARHHDACWEEAGACGSCRGTHRMERRGLAGHPPVDFGLHRRQSAVLQLAGAIGLGLSPLTHVSGTQPYYTVVTFLPLMIGLTLLGAMVVQWARSDRRGAAISFGLALSQGLAGLSLFAIGYGAMEYWPQWFWAVVLPIAAVLGLLGWLARRGDRSTAG